MLGRSHLLASQPTWTVLRLRDRGHSLGNLVPKLSYLLVLGPQWEHCASRLGRDQGSASTRHSLAPQLMTLAWGYSELRQDVARADGEVLSCGAVRMSQRVFHLQRILRHWNAAVGRYTATPTNIPLCRQGLYEGFNPARCDLRFSRNAAVGRYTATPTNISIFRQGPYEEGFNPPRCDLPFSRTLSQLQRNDTPQCKHAASRAQSARLTKDDPQLSFALHRTRAATHCFAESAHPPWLRSRDIQAPRRALCINIHQIFFEPPCAVKAYPLACFWAARTTLRLGGPELQQLLVLGMSDIHNFKMSILHFQRSRVL
ncbi:hypothetical protein B0H12DRAFT_1079429 [Mycena haematopus]|nr:hypothetical protein B0H12DRAFT_1079429 [Mycena haematopus]